MEICKKVLEHLNEDRKTWIELSKMAMNEAKSDEHLINKLKKVI